MQARQTADDYVLTALLPGLTAEEITIQFDNGVLTLEGEYKDTLDENEECLFSELPTGHFKRSIKIKDPVKVEDVDASMKNGVLTIRLPKAEEAKPRSIKIK
jgi:HSP20 family protein